MLCHDHYDSTSFSLSLSLSLFLFPSSPSFPLSIHVRTSSHFVVVSLSGHHFTDFIVFFASIEHCLLACGVGVSLVSVENEVKVTGDFVLQHAFIE